MAANEQPRNPLAAASLSTDNKPSSIASASSQQSLFNDSTYSHMSDTTHGDTSSTSSSPHDVAEDVPTHTQPPGSLTLPNLPSPPPSITNDESIPFHARKNYAHATWARTFHSRPELHITPHSIPELQRTVALARKCRRRLVTVGAGHSPSDLTCTSAWMLSLDHLSSVLDVQVYPQANTSSSAAAPGRRPSQLNDGGFGLAQSDSPTDPKQAPPRYAGRALVQAGITLEMLNLEAEEHGLTLPNLGSIHIQSLAGAIATATHGSSMRHGIISSSVRGLRIMLASGEARWCSTEQEPELFRAALVSLGALGVITEVEIELAPARKIAWESTLWDLDAALAQWHGELWTQAEFVRCWWMPYTRRLVVWKADKTDQDVSPESSGGLGSAVGFHLYQSLLLLANWLPRLVPTVEWAAMGIQHGFGTGKVGSGVSEQRTGLLMDCLYSQFVNEWAIPFDKGPEAITRLDQWLVGESESKASGIPFNNKGLYAHAPIEVRVGNTGSAERSGNEEQKEGDPSPENRAFLDPTCANEPTLYLNATLYRPYGSGPPWKDKYYEAFEWTMKQLGGRPHWAKNFKTVSRQDVEGMYGEGLDKWRAVREDVDPDGMFCGDWHRRLILGEEAGNKVDNGHAQVEKYIKQRRMICEEEEVDRKDKWSGGIMWKGRQAVQGGSAVGQDDDEMLTKLVKDAR